MLHFKIVNNAVVEVASKCPSNVGWISRHDLKSYAAAIELANLANEFKQSQLYLAVDKGSNVSPQFDVVELPQIGDPVSYGFNGDYYEDGTIVSISSTYKVIETSTGNRYYRRKLTGCWKRGGTWSLVMGHHDEKNPHL